MAPLAITLFVLTSIALLGAFLYVTVREMKNLGGQAGGVRVRVQHDPTTLNIPRQRRSAFRRARPAEA